MRRKQTKEMAMNCHVRDCEDMGGSILFRLLVRTSSSYKRPNRHK